jgi:DNA recombination-dependent growth factor C
MNPPNTSSEVDYRRIANRIRDAYTLNEAEQLLTEFMNQSEIEGRINALEELPITEIKESNGRRTNCVLSEEIYKSIEINKFVNQMKGKDK